VIPRSSGVRLEDLLLVGRELPIVGVPHGGVHDPVAVGGIAPLGVISSDLGETFQLARRRLVGVEVHLGVVVPGVAAPLPCGTHLELRLLLLLGSRIMVSRAEEDVAGVSLKNAQVVFPSRRRRFVSLS
jgi:hypothetical protein